MANPLNIVVIGGGTGSFTLLQALKLLTPNITAIVSMSDDGGSTGKLRDELDVLPPGDVRQCLVALSDAPEIRELFNYRFGEGSLAGQSLGNIILSGLELQHGSLDKAISVASSILRITGQVVPVTLDKHELVMDDGGEIIRGEDTIGNHTIRAQNPRIYFEPKAELNPRAEGAILAADLLVIAPGSLYRSLVPNLAVSGMKQAIEKTNAQIVVVSNLVTQHGQTDGWHVVDFVKVFEQYVGEGQVDVVLYNNKAPSTRLLNKYAAHGDLPLATDLQRFPEIRATPVGAPLVASEITPQPKNDTLIRRTLIRHDAHQVGVELMHLYGN